MMADSLSRDALLKEYNETRTSIRSDDKELFQRSRAYLTNKAADRRFPALGRDLYRWLRKLVNHSDNPRPDAILNIKAGLSHLEQYALNLWRSPWRKEFHVIKTYTGFFKCKVERSLPDITTAVWLITCLGYTQDVESKDHFLLKEPLDVQKIQQVSLDLFLVTVDLQIIHEIAIFAEREGYSLKQAIKARCKTVRGIDEAISWLRNESKDPSMKKFKLDKDSGTRDDPEGVGQTSNKSSVNSRAERTLNSQGRTEQEQHEEASQSRSKGTDRETKFPPSFSASSSPSERACTRDISATHYPYHSAFDLSYQGASVPGSYVDPAAVRIRESQVEQLTDYQLYGHDDHSAEHHFPASTEELQMTHLSYSDGLMEDERNTTVSQELLLSIKEEKLYVNLPEKTPAFTTRTADAGLYQNVVIPAPILSPGSPPPDYINQDDYVVIEPMDVDPAETRNMRTGGLSDKRNDGYDPQLYQSKGTRQIDLSSVNVSMSETLVLDRKSTSRATANTGSSRNGDVYSKGRSALHEPGSGVTVLETERREGSQRSAYSLREVKGSVSDRLSTRSTEGDKERHYEVGKQLSEGFKNVHHDEVPADFQTSAEKQYSTDRTCVLAGYVQTSIKSSGCKPCDVCSVEVAELICTHCYQMVCEDCQELFGTNLCDKKIGQHVFLNLRDAGKGSKKTSAQRPPPGAPAESPKPWNCTRCTYVNPAESNICSMCSKTRGMSNPELPEPGSPVCRQCTYCNKEGSEVCEVCCKSLRLGTAETSV